MLTKGISSEVMLKLLHQPQNTTQVGTILKKPLLGNDELIVGEWCAVRENDSKFIDRLRYLGGDFFKYDSGRSTFFSVEQATWTRWADFEDFIFSAYQGNMENLRAQTSLPKLEYGHWYFVINGFQA